MGIFDGIETQPGDFEVALQQIVLAQQQTKLSQLGKEVGEVDDLTETVLSIVGKKRDETGKLVNLTEQEQFDNLTPQGQQNFNILKLQREELEKAFAGDLPVSERLKQRGEEAFGFLQEGQARRGNVITGTNLRNAAAFSTPGIQSLAATQRNQRLLEDEEARDVKDRGLLRFQQGVNLQSTLRQRRLDQLLTSPTRFNTGGSSGAADSGAGLLSNIERRQIIEGQTQAAINQNLQDLITGGTGRLIDLIFKP